MERHATLDVACRAAKRRLIFFLLLFFLPMRAPAQAGDPAAEKLSEIKKLYEAENWGEVVRAVAESPAEPADLLLYRGLALAHLQRWDEAKAAFAAGQTKAPGDPRFLIEAAGVAYREKEFPAAKRDLRRALALNPKDEYANNFLASIYFQEGNLESALRYWNRAGKPKLEDLTFEPALKLRPLVVDRAFAFAWGGEWQREQFLTTQARLRALDLYPGMFFELRAHDDGSFDLGFHAAERNGWGSTKWEGLVSLLRDLPYQAVDPEFYNLNRAGLNWVSTYRWDDEKRRVFTEVAAPVFENPAARFRIYFDGRNENWNITNTFMPVSPSLARLNLEKAVAGAEMRFIESGRWEWSAGAEYSYREFRNVFGIPSAAAPFFTDGSSIALRSSVQRWLIRFPERRFTLNSSGSGEFGTFFRDPLGRYGRLEGAGCALAAKGSRGRLRDANQLAGRAHDRRRAFRRVVYAGIRSGHAAVAARASRAAGRTKGRCAAGKKLCVSECGDGQNCLSEWNFHGEGGTVSRHRKNLRPFGVFWISEMALGYGSAGENSRARRSADCSWVRQRFAFGTKFIFHDGDEVAGWVLSPEPQVVWRLRRFAARDWTWARVSSSVREQSIV